MISNFYKWLFSLIILFSLSSEINHPIFVSVTEIEHNEKDNILEISCKIFTNDFESTLRKKSAAKIDLLNPKDKSAMDKLVSSYLQQHLKIWVDGNLKEIKYIGYEQTDESIESYFQIDNVKTMKKITVKDNILYEFKEEQMSLIHVIEKGVRKSTRLINPEDTVEVQF
jgi:hypothetical protein